MSELSGKIGELRMTIEVKRKETGKVDTYFLVGKVTEEQAEKLGLKESENGSDTQHVGPQRGD